MSGGDWEVQPMWVISVDDNRGEENARVTLMLGRESRAVLGVVSKEERKKIDVVFVVPGDV